MSEDLQALRAKIDGIDEQLQQLLNQRASYAQQIAEIKREQNLLTHYYRPEREAQILRTIQQRNSGPLSNDAIAMLFREIMSACLALEQPLRIAYLGPVGTFTELATLKHFGQSVTTLPLATIDQVFREVEAGTAGFGVVPIENSTEGVVNHTLDMFMQSPLQICGEAVLRIHHHLLTQATALHEIHCVVAHQQALAQCRSWLNTHLPGIEQRAVSSNAEAARLASEDITLAALGSQHAADIYQLGILASNIEDEPRNTTRFLVIGKQETPPSGRDKTSIMVAAKNRAGALYNLLASLANYERSMTRIESRPSRQGIWEYVFFIDIEGHKDELAMQRALRALEKEAALLKILGSYPCAVLQ